MTGSTITTAEAPRRSAVVGVSPAATMGKYGVLLVGVFVALFPTVLVISTATRDPGDVRVHPFRMFDSFSLNSLIDAWTIGGYREYFVNTLLMAVPATILTVALSCAAGYAFARCRFRGRDTLFYVTTLGLLVPFFSLMIPLYFQLLQMGLLNSWLGVALVLTSTGASGLSFGIYLMRSFFQDLPDDLEQAARIDGCSEWQVFSRVMLPLGKSGAAALAVFAFLQNWNSFIVPLLYLPGSEKRTIPVALQIFASGRTLELGSLAAGVLISMLPVICVFLLAQRQLIQGLMAGAVKG